MAQTKTLHLLTDDYAERLELLYSAAQAAREVDPGDLLADEDHPYVTLQREHEDLRAEAEAASEAAGRKVILEAVGRRRGREGRPSWRDLKEKHPPRTEGDDDVVKGDRLAGVNVDTVEDDLLYASVTYPPASSRGAFDEWADGLSEGEFQTLIRAAWRLANIAEFDPKSLPVSLILRSDASTQ